MSDTPDLVHLIGGPLDGQTIPVDGWTPEQRAGGAYLISPHGAYGPGGRSDYEPDPDGDPTRWTWRGDVP